MSKLPCSILAIVLAPLILCPDDAHAQSQWVGPKFYFPPAVTITLPPLAPGAPAPGTIDALPAGTAAIFVTHDLKNISANPLAGYPVSEHVVRLTFVSIGGRAGWVPAVGPGAMVADITIPGPTLSPNATAPVGFGPIVLPGCGMYRETLSAPHARLTRRFAVPGTITIAKNVVPPVPDIVMEDAPPTNYAVTFAATGGLFWTFGPTLLPVNGFAGSQATFLPPRPPGRTVPGAAAFATTYRVTPRNLHGRAVCTDILQPFVDETVNSLVTAISVDGCTIAQLSLQISVRHPCIRD